MVDLLNQLVGLAHILVTSSLSHLLPRLPLSLFLLFVLSHHPSAIEAMRGTGT